MNIIDLYLFKSIFRATLVVGFVFASLSLFVDFVSQSDDIGIGSYGAFEAMQYSLMKLPSSLIRFIPIIVLIGSLVALGNLGKNSELIVLMSSGFSFFRLSLSVLFSGILLALIFSGSGEYIFSPLERYADQFRTKNKFNIETIGDSGGFWVIDESKIININFVKENSSFGEVTIFEINDNFAIQKISQASSAGIDDFNQWILSNLSETLFTDNGIESNFSRYQIERTDLDRDLVSLSVTDSDELNIIELSRFIDYLENNNLDTKKYRTAFHNRLASFMIIPILALLALQMSVGSQRKRGSGFRILIGMIIGLAYFIAQNTILESSQIFEIRPEIIGYIPLTFVVFITMILFSIRRTP
ncbi:MAG: LPS export ABC transporter permease LptG [Gammaproteobacteria bacterium]|nr:LPS export ABC transporter permease LptG [Gammaproteobacteria bacterium]OUT94335.1 MAG: LPS export ABC transporter permease LptG [Gammaproteobacteria bacterium TMED36]|tara:strand:- start:11472 stop:12545 length:1074 start_codon:yes stop_codon:yes gene_type:complete